MGDAAAGEPHEPRMQLVKRLHQIGAAMLQPLVVGSQEMKSTSITPASWNSTRSVPCLAMTPRDPPSVGPSAAVVGEGTDSVVSYFVHDSPATDSSASATDSPSSPASATCTGIAPPDIERAHMENR